MTAVAIASERDPRWEAIARRAPRMAETMLSYLDQMGVSLRPASIDAVELALRGFADYATREHRLRRVRSVQRVHVEGFKPIDGWRTLAAIEGIARSGRTVVVYRAGRTAAG